MYKDWKNKDIHLEEFPSIEKVKKSKFGSEEIIELNSQIWNYKKANNKPLNSEIPKVLIPKKFKIIDKDLANAHKIKQIEFGDEFKIEN